MKRIMIVVALLGGIMFMTPTASATGTDAVVTVEILLNGDIEVTSTKDLSNVRIAVCVEAEVQIVKFDGLEDKVEVFDVDGTLIAVLAKSGNNTTAEAEALLVSLGGVVSGNSTGVIAFYDEEADEDCTLSAFICFEGEITTLTHDDQTELNLLVSAFLELNVGAEQVVSADAECEEEVVVTTTTTAPPVVTTTTAPPATDTPVAAAPRSAAPVATQAPVSQPVPVTQLPRTGSGALGLLLGGLSLVGTGSALRILSKMRRANA